MKGLLIAAATAALVVAGVWVLNANNEPHGVPPGEATAPAPGEAARDPGHEASAEGSLRDRLLHATAAEVGIKPARGVWGVIMERGYTKGVATIVALEDGTASMYISTGGAVVGGKGYPPAHDAAIKLCDRAADALGETIAAHEFPSPAKGRVRFYVLTTEGVRVAEDDIFARADAGHGALAPLLAAGDAVIDGLKEATSKGLLR
jgi:hypothetical protein